MRRVGAIPAPNSDVARGGIDCRTKADDRSMEPILRSVVSKLCPVDTL